MVDQLSLQAGRVTVYQDVDDTTAFTVEVTKDGSPVDLSGSTWADPDGLMTVDTTNAASGKLGLSCGTQTGNQDWRLQADGDTTYLQGTLVVGSTRHVEAGTGTVAVAVENQTVTVSAVTANHDHNGAYAPVLAPVSIPFIVGAYIETAHAPTFETFQDFEGFFRATPVWFHTGTTVDRLSCEVTTAGTAGAVVRLGIYESDDQGAPSALLLDAGTVDATTTGGKEITVSQAVGPGLYWFGAATQGGATTRPTVRTYGRPGPLALKSSATDTSSVGVSSSSGTVTGALPSTFPALAVTNRVPRVLARLA